MANTKKIKNNEYKNYKLSRRSENSIDTIQLDDPKVTKEWFFENYIKPRKPLLIKASKSGKVQLNVDDFKPEKILETLNAEQDKEEKDDKNPVLLQVEELNQGGFGSGKKRLKLELEEFLSRINKGDPLYLTTQYSENDEELSDVSGGEFENDNEEGEEGEDNEEDEENDEVEKDRDAAKSIFPEFNGNLSDDDEITDMHDDFDDIFDEENTDAELDEETIDPIYQPPLTNLLGGKLDKLPPHPMELTESLVPQQINIWFGRTPDKSTLLDINESENGEGVISINKGLPTPNSTSTGLHHDHADNIYVLVQGKKRFTLFSPDFAPDLYTVGDVRHVYDTGVIDYLRNENARGWNNVRADGGCIESDETKQSLNPAAKEIEEEQDPPSFCKIPPALLHLDEVEEKNRKKLEIYAKKNFPRFYPVMNSSIKVTLEDGDLLYLPAGWFHEVTSFGDAKKNNTHVAVNYWFVPPDGVSITRPYSDKVWEDNFQKWKKKYL